ncbi:serine hydrolase [Cryptosporangium japonicum]|uniref:Beta-lactamase-related domain-containing protein n=1 Tax=Cryptosporangium japonicum TaxID=80872 RepID=A0ABP3EU46_9ACTN
MAGSQYGKAQVHYDLTSDEYSAVHDRFVRGHRVVDLRGYLVGTEDRYAVVYEPDASTVRWWSHPRLDPDGLEATKADHLAEGRRPVLFTGYASSAGRSFAGVWDDVPGPQRSLHYDQPIDAFRTHEARARRREKRVVDLSAYRHVVPTERSLFSTIWDDDDGRTDWMLTGPSDSPRAQAEFDRHSAAGWSVVRSSGWSGPDGVRYVTLWERVASTFVAVHGWDRPALERDLAAHQADGLRPEQLGPYPVDSPPVARYTPIWRRRDADVVVPALVAEFARGYGLPAVSLAIARGDQVIYTHGHGELVQPEGPGLGSDLVVPGVGTIPEPVITPARPVDPDGTLFRIASVSKTITAAAVLRLVERGTIGLDDQPFAARGALAAFAPTPADSRLRDIRVRHLLQHGAGGWPNDGDDPMWSHRELSTDDLVRTVLAETPLDTDPGTAYAYSNFGYCLLGRLIEAVTGRTYAQHVREDLLRACGVTGMLTARDAPPNGDIIRCYPAPGDEDPYRIRIDRMDAHGGWLATAVDVLRFAVRVDGSGPDVLDPSSVAFMTTPSGLAGNSGYGAGWTTSDDDDAEPGVGFHSGVLPGATGLLQRAPDGLTAVVLTNTNVRHDTPDRTTDTLAGLFRLLARIRGQVDYW